MFAADCLLCLRPHLAVELELEHFKGNVNAEWLEQPQFAIKNQDQAYSEFIQKNADPDIHKYPL